MNSFQFCVSMKSLTIIFFLSASLVYAQPLRDKVQGTWVCTHIVDSIGQAATGELGTSINYLKFRFKGSRLFIAQAPFDVGTVAFLGFRDNYFYLIGVQFIQTQYYVISVDESNMVLRTSHLGKTITYHFSNQNKYSVDLDQIRNFRDVGQITISLTYWKDNGNFFRNTFYLIENSLLNLIPCPQFNSKEFTAFGEYIGSNLIFPETFTFKVNSNELIIEFDVTPVGVENIEIVVGLSPEMDAEIYDLIGKSSKKWAPLVYQGKAIDTRIRIGFLFIYNEL